MQEMSLPDVEEAHCYVVDIGQTDREQIRSIINNNCYVGLCQLRTNCTQLTKAYVAEMSCISWYWFCYVSAHDQFAWYVTSWQSCNEARVFQGKLCFLDTRPHFHYSRVADAILPSNPAEQRNFDGDRGRNGIIDLLQIVTKLTAAIVTKNWRQPELRIQHIISRYGAKAGHRNSYIYTIAWQFRRQD